MYRTNRLQKGCHRLVPHSALPHPVAQNSWVFETRFGERTGCVFDLQQSDLVALVTGLRTWRFECICGSHSPKFFVREVSKNHLDPEDGEDGDGSAHPSFSFELSSESALLSSSRPLTCRMSSIGDGNCCARVSAFQRIGTQSKRRKKHPNGHAPKGKSKKA